MESVITGLVSRFGYWGVLLLIAVENIFPPIPSEVILTFGGFLTTCTEMTPPGIILFSTLGSVAGAIVLYGVGRKPVRRLVHVGALHFQHAPNPARKQRLQPLRGQKPPHAVQHDGPRHAAQRGKQNDAGGRHLRTGR